MLVLRFFDLPPSLDPIEDQTVSLESPFSLTVTATDPDLPANVLTFSASLDDGGTLPDWREAIGCTISGLQDTHIHK